MHGETLKNNVE